MPIPTPEPPVNLQRDLVTPLIRFVQRSRIKPTDGQIEHALGIIAKLEALLVQRAQESGELLQAVLDAIKGTLDTSTQIADHPNVKFAQMQRLTLEAQLTARAQEIEQVKDAVSFVVTTFERDEAQGYRSRDRQFAIEILKRHADAALVSRAPQPEKKDHDDRSANRNTRAAENVSAVSGCAPVLDLDTRRRDGLSDLQAGNPEAARQTLLAAPLPASAALQDAAEMLWVVLANVSGGDWTQQSKDWQEAAARWRDNYFTALRGIEAPLHDRKD